MTYDELPDHPALGVCLYCHTYGCQFSADAGDYFLRTPTRTIDCGKCGNPLSLVRKRITMDPIDPTKADS